MKTHEALATLGLVATRLPHLGNSMPDVSLDRPSDRQVRFHDQRDDPYIGGMRA